MSGRKHEIIKSDEGFWVWQFDEGYNKSRASDLFFPTKEDASKAIHQNTILYGPWEEPKWQK